MTATLVSPVQAKTPAVHDDDADRLPPGPPSPAEAVAPAAEEEVAAAEPPADPIMDEVAAMEREAEAMERMRAVRDRMFPTIDSKIAYIQAHAGAVQKSARNEDAGWRFAPIEAFYALLEPLWNKTGVIVTFHRGEIRSQDVRGSDGRNGQRTALDLVMRVADPDHPDRAPFEIAATGEAVDYAGKDLNQAFTYGIRNAFIAGFRLRSGEEPDAHSIPQGQTLPRAQAAKESDAERTERQQIVPEIMQLLEGARLNVNDVREVIRRAADSDTATSQNAPLPALRATRDRVRLLSEIERAAVPADMHADAVDDLVRVTANDQAATRLTADIPTLERVRGLLLQMGPPMDDGGPAAAISGKYGEARDLR